METGKWFDIWNVHAPFFFSPAAEALQKCIEHLVKGEFKIGLRICNYLHDFLYALPATNERFPFFEIEFSDYRQRPVFGSLIMNSSLRLRVPCRHSSARNALCAPWHSASGHVEFSVSFRVLCVLGALLLPTVCRRSCIECRLSCGACIFFMIFSSFNIEFLIFSFRWLIGLSLTKIAILSNLQ